MKFVSPETLDRFRQARQCEFCLAATVRGADPAHIFARGRDNGFQMDIPENLASLCRPCHNSNHAGGRPHLGDLLEIVGAREGLWVDDLLLTLKRLRME